MFSGPEAFGDFVCAQKKDEEEDEDGGVDEGESATNRSPCLKKTSPSVSQARHIVLDK